MTYQMDPGTTMAAAQALTERRGGVWTDEQVAYLIALAYQAGRVSAAGEDLAEAIGCWAEHASPSITREQRVRERLDEMDRRYGSARYAGGPVDWNTGRPARALEVAA